jgi:hypothetical protein
MGGFKQMNHSYPTLSFVVVVLFVLPFKKVFLSWVLVADAYNPSYTGGLQFQASPGK